MNRVALKFTNSVQYRPQLANDLILLVFSNQLIILRATNKQLF